MRARVIVGLMGGEEQAKEAREIGHAVAASGHVLLTGARVGTPDSQRVHLAAMHGACSQGNARLIGILPGNESPHFEPLEQTRGFYLHTGMSSEERDSMTGLTPDVQIFLRGGTGTLLELAYAAVGGRPILFLDSVAGLMKKAKEPARQPEIQRAFAVAQRRCPEVDDASVQVPELISQLLARLSTASDSNLNADALVGRAIQAALASGLPSKTGFPDAVGRTEKLEFERRVREME